MRKRIKMDNKKIIELYLEFKNECVNKGILDIQEIIGLFETKLNIEYRF